MAHALLREPARVVPVAGSADAAPSPSTAPAPAPSTASAPAPAPAPAHTAGPGVGQGTWHAALQLGYRADNGRTIPVLRSHQGPLRILKGHAQSTADCWEQIIVHPPGGIAARDELAVTIDARADAQVLFTTPGATKWYRAPTTSSPGATSSAAVGRDGPSASQTTRITVSDGASVEWLPLENIFFDGCNARLDTRIDLDATASLIMAELFCLGRPASHAPFSAGRVRTRTEIRRDGRPIFIERASLSGGDRALLAAAGLGGHACFGTLLAVPTDAGRSATSHEPSDNGLVEAAQRNLRILVAAARDALLAERPCGDDEVAVTALSASVAVRWRGDSAEAGWAALRCAWRALRPHVTGLEPESPRIWAC